jgi:hypothetical protein
MFDWKFYINYYKELHLATEEEASLHWKIYGEKEGRIGYDMNTMIDINISELSDEFSIINLSKNIEPEILSVLEEYDVKDKIYFRDIDKFLKIYKTTYNKVITDPKMEFRYFCYRYLDYIRNITLPSISLKNKYEAVLIEYRQFPHLEFLIRNMISKLGCDWSHTVVCGNINYDYMVNICNSISPNIHVIRTDYDSLNQTTYSKFMASVEFWNMFHGEKILIYQEDSIIFKNNINDFIKWDYIGAPWPKTQNDNMNCVGNGGFSLRTKQCMINVINTISIENTAYNNSTLEYMKNSKMTIGPEDVYFSLNMIRYNIGKVADWDSASLFSTESIVNNDSMGGHNFWINNKMWKKRLYDNNVIQFKPHYNMNTLEHRGGWKTIINNLEKNDFFNNSSDIYFFDMIEKQFLWDTNYYCNNKWAGIIHCTQFTPPYLNIINIKYLFNNPNFIKSLKNCIYIVCLAKNVTNYMQKRFDELNINVKLYTLKHPIGCDDIIMFNVNDYINNTDKYLLQIGQQLRKMSSIYRLKDTNGHKKKWLTGTKNFDKCIVLLKKEIEYLNIKNITIDVEMYYTETYEEYDILLLKNIVFIDLFDAAANNTVLECIVRGTPIIVNRIEGVVEYLGEDYPLYFNNLDDVPRLLNIDNIMKAHEYLVNMNKDDIMIDTFRKNLLSLI